MNLLGIVVSYIYIFFIILSAKLIEKKGKEVTRKYIHIMLANWWLIAMFFFDQVWYACFVPATFVIINYVSYKKDLIGVMERSESEKDGLGTVYYALSLLILAAVIWGLNLSPIIGLAGVFAMGYGDGFAAVVGKNVKRLRKEKKITQEDLCARMQVMGYQISRSDISKLENGKKFIADFEVYGFAKALKVSILELFPKN